MTTRSSSREGLVQLRCGCGVRLRVADALRRDGLRCDACQEADDRALLRAFGIDPDAARRAYEEERRRRRRCARCARRLEPAAQPDDGDEERVCDACRAAAVEQRGRPAAAARAAAKRPAPAPARAGAEELRRLRAGAYGALLLVGVTGFTASVVGAPPAAALLVGALAAGVGARATWGAYAPT